MKVIITGANGFVGSSLVKKFIENDAEVLAVDVSFDQPKFEITEKVRTIESDLNDLDTIKNQIEIGEYKIFYNLAWKGVNGPDKANYDIQLSNIITSLKCAELAKFLGCSKYLCAGTIAERAVESLPCLEKTSGGMMYAVAKHCNRLMLENYCKCIDLNFVWMQFSNIYGPKNKTGNLISYTLNQLNQGLPATFGPAKQPYDFIYVDDLIEAVYRLGIYPTSQNEYFIGSGTPKILSDYLIKIGNLYGKPELIQIGVREDDHIKYSFEMLDTKELIDEIGDFVSGSFEELIKYTIEGF